MIIKQKTISEVISNAIRILTSQIGAADTARFINRLSVGFGDYTEERKQILTLKGFKPCISHSKK